MIQSSDPDSMNTLIEEAKGLNDVICNADAPVVKSDLSKYVDEKLLKFDPSTYRKPQKQQDSTGSTAIQPNTGENSSLVATNSILGKRSIQLEELEQDAKLSICHEGDSDAESTLESETVKLSPEKENAIQAVLTKDSENPRKKRVSFSELAKSLVTSEHLVNSSDHKLEGSIFSDVSRCLTVNGEGYFRLNVLGKGGSSCVHRIVSKSDGKIYAYKRVDVKESDDIDGVFNSYANEISLLKSLQGSNCIIELVDYQLRHSENYIEMVLEAGDIDLAKVLSQKLGQSKRSQTPASLNPFFARMVWSEMLEAVNFIHENRIVHG